MDDFATMATFKKIASRWNHYFNKRIGRTMTE